MDGAAMNAHMVDYFYAEKAESVIFVVLGITAILSAALVFFKWKSFRGMMVPLIAVGLIRLAVGSGILLRTGEYIRRLSEFL